MYIIVVIRLSTDIKQFQNTEINRFASALDVEDELRNDGCTDKDIEILHALKIRQHYTFNSTILTGVNRGTRFIYVFRVS